MQPRCSICGRFLRKQAIGDLYCSKCYRRYKKEIINKSEWVIFCRNWEKRRRYAESKDDGLIYLGDLYDLADGGAGYELVPLDGYYEEFEY